jgi:hypothetical protein
MKKPNILSALYDAEHNMTYHVLAYRKLSELEMVETVKLYLSQPKIVHRKTRERDKTVTTCALMGSERAFAFGL